VTKSEEWRPRWFYILRNKTSGKLYVGQTVRKNMDNYCGSGRYWKAHCRKHGGHTRSNIEVVEQTWFTSETHANEWLDILAESAPDYFLCSNEAWANQARETTKDSAFCGVDHKAIWAQPGQREKRSAAIAQAFEDPEMKARHLAGCVAAQNRPEVSAQKSEILKQLWSDPEARLLRIAGLTAALNDPVRSAKHKEAMASVEVRERISAGTKASFERPGARERCSASTKEAMQRPEVRERLLAANNDPDLNARRVATRRKTMSTPAAKARMSAQSSGMNNPSAQRKNLHNACVRLGIQVPLKRQGPTKWSVTDYEQALIAFGLTPDDIKSIRKPIASD